MKIEALNAWLLHKRAYGENSAYVTFFTAEKGIVTCNCKGAKSAKKSPLLQAFLPLWITLDRRFIYLQQIEAIGPSLYLTADSLFAGLYINELVYNFLKPCDVHETVFTKYIEALNELAVSSSRNSISIILRTFEMQLLAESGYALNLLEDMDNNPFDEEKFYVFTPGLGFKAAKSGFAGKHIIDLEKNRLDNLETLRIAKKITRSAIDYVLDGKNIKARSLYLTEV